MGADMIGYQTMIPVEFTKEEKEKLKAHLNDIEILLRTPNLAKNVADETVADGKYLSQLNELVPNLPNQIDDEGLVEKEDIEALLHEYVGIIPDAIKFIKEPHVSERDSSTRIYNILGRKYQSIFAGELSWGDEPEGGGYEKLKNLDKLNILWKIEHMTIPQSKSLHFIKEDDDES